jgi:putative DNA methylase
MPFSATTLGQVMFAVALRKGANTTFVAPDQVQLSAAAAVPFSHLSGIQLPDVALGFRVQQYGLRDFLDLFTRRQAYALETFSHLVEGVYKEIVDDAARSGLADDGISLESGGRGARAYADAVAAVLGLCVGKMAQSNNILVRWFIDPRNGSGKATPAFDRQAIPMVWDFVETNPFGGSVGDWTGPVLNTALRAFDLVVPEGPPTDVVQQDARLVARHLPTKALIATDPPYYANIGYADLSDFFYLWLREVLKSSFPSLFSTVATPKVDELIAAPYRHAGSVERANEYFRTGFAKVFGQLAERADPRFPILIVYAIKQAEESDETTRSTGWDVFLAGLVDAGLTIVATWPVRTTTDTRMRGIGSNALASAIFVVARRRPQAAPTISRREFIGELKVELPVALGHLQRSNIAPVDLAQAAIGPGMAVFTRYSNVRDAAGKPLSVREALALVNQVLDEALAEQEGDFDADSRWALAWFEQAGFAEGEYGMAETLSKAKNTSVGGMVEAGIVVSRGGKVRLRRPAELPASWDPSKDHRLTAWEMVHQLIRALEDPNGGGEEAAAVLVAKLGAKAEVARELAYLLYALCERKKRAAEALSYNALVQSWPEITRLAQGAATEQQGVLI